MLSIKKLNYQSFAKTTGEKSRISVEIFADTISDLPETEGFDGYTLCMGSIAYVIETGEMYVLGSDGQWYGSGGRE
ncbi:MAG: hypothetical protein NC485_15230 [Ruminococcus flavefaciens]|nr:hypothetical protein [Ruminococcus flavefaciens]MCM1062779.1 hypothetical protein [Eubacterium sp.]